MPAGVVDEEDALQIVYADGDLHTHHPDCAVPEQRARTHATATQQPRFHHSRRSAHVVPRIASTRRRHPVWCQQECDVLQTMQRIGSCCKVPGVSVLGCCGAAVEKAVHEVGCHDCNAMATCLLSSVDRGLHSLVCLSKCDSNLASNGTDQQAQQPTNRHSQAGNTQALGSTCSKTVWTLRTADVINVFGLSDLKS